MHAASQWTAFAAIHSGATVVLHDINLPLLQPNFPDWGAKHLFDGLALEKAASDDKPLPNIGSLVMPEEPALLREPLQRIARAHQWQAKVPQAYLDRLGLTR